MTDAERPPEGEREGLKPKKDRGPLYAVAARKILEIAQSSEHGVTLADAEDALSESGMKVKTEAQKAKMRKHASFVINRLEMTGLLWARGSHFESRAALNAQNFSDEHVKRNPFDTQKSLTAEQIDALPDWLAELVRSNA